MRALQLARPCFDPLQLREQVDAEKDELYKQIVQMKVELDFLKQRAGLLS